MSTTDIDRTDALDVFLFTQERNTTNVTDVKDEFTGRINTAYARQILRHLNNLGLIIPSAWDQGEYEGYHWEQGAERAFDEAWKANTAKTDNTTGDKTTARKCTCGCDAFTNHSRAIYLPGHDARHASQVAKALAHLHETEDGTLTPEDAAYRTTLLRALPSDALRTKALQQAKRLQAKALRKATRESSKRTAEDIGLDMRTWVEGTAKIGRWTYPARKRPNGRTAQVNNKRDGSGQWKALDPAKFVPND